MDLITIGLAIIGSSLCAMLAFAVSLHKANIYTQQVDYSEYLESLEDK